LLAKTSVFNATFHAGWMTYRVATGAV
jgi:hypothetical protein